MRVITEIEKISLLLLKWLVKNEKTKSFDFGEFLNTYLVNADLIEDCDLKKVVDRILEATEGDPWRVISFLKEKNFLRDNPLGGYTVTQSGISKVEEMEGSKKLERVWQLIRNLKLWIKRRLREFLKRIG